MRGEQYYLILVDKNGVLYRVYKRPLTLLMIDERTTKYENKKELIETVIKNTSLDLNPKDIVDVKIFMQPNSKKDEYKNVKGPLYKKDQMVLNTEATTAKLELFMLDKAFAREFIKKYKGIKNFTPICNRISVDLNNNVDYIEDLTSLVEKILKTYKGCRNIYFIIKQYQSKVKKALKDRQFDSDEEADTTKEDTLRYLNTHERELLDIEDFTHYEELSEFDAHKKL